jgi:DNA-binding response OmpR family regulator
MDNVRIICISGMVETGKIQELTEAGANEFMKKPFDVDVLLAHICQLLDVESLPAK